MTSSKSLTFSFPGSDENVRLGDAYDLESIDNGVDDIPSSPAPFNYSRTIVTPPNQNMCMYMFNFIVTSNGTSISVSYPPGGNAVIVGPGASGGFSNSSLFITTQFLSSGALIFFSMRVLTTYPQFTVNVVNNTTATRLYLAYTQIPAINPISTRGFIGQLGRVYGEDIEGYRRIATGTPVSLEQNAYMLTYITGGSGSIIISGTDLEVNNQPVVSPFTFAAVRYQMIKIAGENLQVTGMSSTVMGVIVTEQLPPSGTITSPSQNVSAKRIDLNGFIPQLGSGPVSWNGFNRTASPLGLEAVHMASAFI